MSKNVKAEFLKDGRIRLIRDFGEVPRGFICDGASVPRFCWRLFGHPYDRKHIRGGVRHDWGYTIGGDEALRKAIDEQYREDLKADGQGFILRWLEYFAVRLGGRSHYNNTEKGKTMKKLIAITPAILTVALCTTGCATKSRSFDAKGMYVSETGQLAVGYIHVDAIPEGTESAVVHYEEDTALLSPSTKTHAIDIILTGTNSVASSEGIIEAICDAFVAVAPSVPKASAAATSPLDPAKANADNATAAVIAFPQSLDGKLADGKLTEDEAEDEGGGEEDNLGPGGISKPLH